MILGGGGVGAQPSFMGVTLKAAKENKWRLHQGHTKETNPDTSFFFLSPDEGLGGGGGRTELEHIYTANKDVLGDF